MLYGDVKREIKNLGFESEATILENAEIIADSVNRAVSMIVSSVVPIVKKYSIVQESDAEADGGYVSYVLPEIIPDFLDIFEKPKITVSDVRKTFCEYLIEGNKIMLVPADFNGTIDVYYKAAPTVVTAETPDTFVMEPDLIVCPLIAPLASYFVWLDDDERKATMYYNIYDDMKNSILQNMSQRVPVQFSGGIRWGN